MRELTAIYEEMRDAFAERAGFAPGESCDSAVRLYALAAQVQALHQSFPQTAQGKYLDYHAQTRGIGRMPALHAEGTLRFAAADKVTSELSVDKGAVCMTADGVRFETTEDAVIKKGSVWADVPARAVEAGERGNVIAGMVTVMSARPVGIVQCTNPTAFTGGCDDEDDESLRARILESYRRLPNGANAAYYEKEAMSFPGVAAAKAVGRARGIGTVDVIVAAQEGVPSAQLLATVEAHLQKKREIAVDLRVLAPTEKPVEVKAALSVAVGYDFQEVRRRAEAALRRYFTGAMLGKSVPTVQLLTLLYGVEGVENVHMSLPSADAAALDSELPTLGTLTLSEMTKG